MRRSRLVIVAALTVAFVPPRVEAGPAPLRVLRQKAQRLGSWVRKARATLGQTGVVVTAEAQVGIGLNAIGDVGFRMTAKDEHTGKRKAAPFVSGEVHAFAIGVRGTTSYDRELRGIEKKYGPIGHGSPLYGDRVSVVLFPEVLSVFAGRSGGLGFRLNLFPLVSGPLGYLGRWGGSIYVTNPKLAPAAAWVLDKSDRAEQKFKEWVLAPAKERWSRFKERFALKPPEV